MKVVEIKQHGRTLRRGKQQRREFRPSSRPNRVSIIGGEQPTIGALPRKHVEVIGPEIDHHFLQLALAVDRAQKSRGLEFRGYPLRLLQAILQVVLSNSLTIFFIIQRVRGIVRRCRKLFCAVPIFRLHAHRIVALRRVRRCHTRATFHAVIARRGKISRQSATSLKLSKQLAWLRKLVVKLGSRHVQTREVPNLALRERIGNLLGV